MGNAEQTLTLIDFIIGFTAIKMTRLVEFSDQIQIVSIYHSVVFSSEAHKFFLHVLNVEDFVLLLRQRD